MPWYEYEQLFKNKLWNTKYKITRYKIKMAQVRMPWYEYEPLLTYGCTRSRPGVQVDIFIHFLTNVFMLTVKKYIHPKYH